MPDVLELQVRRAGLGGRLCRLVVGYLIPRVAVTSMEPLLPCASMRNMVSSSFPSWTPSGARASAVDGNHSPSGVVVGSTSRGRAPRSPATAR